MKILCGVQGTGNGHPSRAQALEGVADRLWDAVRVRYLPPTLQVRQTTARPAGV